MTHPNLQFSLSTQVAAAVALILLAGGVIFWLTRKKNGHVGVAHEPEERSGGILWVLTRLAIAMLMTSLIVLCKDRLEQLFPWITGFMGHDILAFFAISFALVQFLDARDEEKGVKKIQGRIQRLLNDATTRSVGSFPKNLKNIIEMIGTAKSSIRIIVDFPGYGIYSDPDLYGEYLKALKAAADSSGVG